MKAVVFLGPSLPVDTARSILDAEYLPPAGQGDVISAVRNFRPDVMAVIDGVMGDGQSPWHKELLYALDEGVRVAGAAGVGAIRAAELAPFGMIGVGEVFRWIKDGEINDDAEVLCRDRNGGSGRIWTIPLVNVRATVARAVGQGGLSADAGARFIQLARSIHYAERTSDVLLQTALEQGLPPEERELFSGLIQVNYVDQQRLDAIALLESIRKGLPETKPDGQARPYRSGPVFRATMSRDRKVRRGGTDVHLHSVSAHYALHAEDYEDNAADALNTGLVLFLARLLEVTPTSEEVAAEVQRFGRKRGIRTVEDRDRWFVENDFSSEEFDGLMQERATCRIMQRWLMTKHGREANTRQLLNRLRLQGRYSEWADRTAERDRFLQRHHADPAAVAERLEDPGTLIVEHLKETGIPMDAPYLEWLETAGLTRAGFNLELLRSKMARDLIGRLALSAGRDERD